MATIDHALSESLRPVLEGGPNSERAGENADAQSLHSLALSAFGRRASSRPDLEILLHDAVGLMGETLGADLGGVSKVASDGRSFCFKLLDVAKREVVDRGTQQLPRDPTASMAAYALTMGSPVFSSDLATEQRFKDHVLCGLGMACGLTVPLTVSEEQFGAIGVYSQRSREFAVEEMRFAESIGHLLSAFVGRTLAEQQLDRRERLSRGLMELLDTIVVTLDPSGNVLDMNRAGQELTGFALDELQGRPFLNALAVPGEAPLLDNLFRAVAAPPGRAELDAFVLAKDNHQRRLHWKAAAVTGAQGEQLGILLHGSCREVPESGGKARAAVPASPTQAEPRTCFSDRRRSPRTVFEYPQLVAPMYANRPPRKEEFFEVPCRNISAGGMALVMPRVPSFKRLVIALGRRPDVVHLTAEIVRVTEESEGQFLVGCRFTGRADPHSDISR